MMIAVVVVNNLNLMHLTDSSKGIAEEYTYSLISFLFYPSSKELRMTYKVLPFLSSQQFFEVN